MYTLRFYYVGYQEVPLLQAPQLIYRHPIFVRNALPIDGPRLTLQAPHLMAQFVSIQFACVHPLPMDGPELIPLTTATHGTICNHPTPMCNTIPIDHQRLTPSFTATQRTIC